PFSVFNGEYNSPPEPYSSVSYSVPKKKKKPTEKEYYKLMKRLMESGENSNFTVIIGDAEIPVNKGILSAHSAVFSTMFRQNNTIEVLESKVNITDVSLEIFTNMLQYMYTGVKPAKECLTEEFLIAADKYLALVQKLKRECEKNLMSQVSVANVIHNFKLADMVCAPLLKENCLKLIINNLKELMCSEEWEKLGQTHYELMVEVFRAIPDSDSCFCFYLCNSCLI
ncbi:hypothetical protein TYRP_017507, partial [Tyrophagus putrescentiae]